MLAIPQALQTKIDQGYNFRFGDYVSQGFNLVAKNVGLFVVYTLVFFVLVMITAIIPFFNILALPFVVPALMTGFFIAAHRTARGENLQFSDFFKGFDKVMPLGITFILQALIGVLASLPGLIMIIGALGFTILSMFDNPDMSLFGLGAMTGTFFIGILLAMFAGLFVSTSYAFSLMLVWFYDLSPWQAMETSRKLAWKNFLILLVFLIVVQIISSVGMMLLFIGALFTVPAGICMVYAAFADITGLEEDEAITNDDIIDHFVAP